MGVGVQAGGGARLESLDQGVGEDSFSWLHIRKCISFLLCSYDFIFIDAPSLKDATEEDIATYTCHSVPIATKARYNHNQELRLQRQPWWHKLGDEYQDQKLDEELDWKVF